MYKVVFDDGKPYEETFKDEAELIKGLENFFILNQNSEYQFDVIILDNKDNDVSDSQFINEMIADILENN